MADFAIQRGQKTIADGNTSVTLTGGGTDYTSPSALSKAFIRIVSSMHSGTQSAGANVNQQNNSCWISNPENLLTSVNFDRYGSTGDVIVNWEIIEYTGSAGGANEFKVLDQDATALATDSNTATTSATSTAATDDDDVVPWITGQGGNLSGSGYIHADMVHTAAWNGAGDTITFTRNRQAAVASTVSWAAVEFTGSNWHVEPVSNTMSGAGNTDTQSTTDVGATSRAFIHPQFNVNSDITANTPLIWLTDTDEVSFYVDTNADAMPACTAWVISNSQTDGTPMVVRRYSDTANSTQTENIAVTEVSSMATTTVDELTASTPQNTTSSFLELMAARLTTTTNVEIRRSRYNVGDNITTRFATVEWPTAPAGGGTPTGQIVTTYNNDIA